MEEQVPSVGNDGEVGEVGGVRESGDQRTNICRCRSFPLQSVRGNDFPTSEAWQTYVSANHLSPLSYLISHFSLISPSIEKSAELQRNLLKSQESFKLFWSGSHHLVIDFHV